MLKDETRRETGSRSRMTILRPEALRRALGCLWVVEVRRAHLAAHLVASALAQPLAAAVEALLVDEWTLAEVVVPRKVVDLLLAVVHLDALVPALLQ